MKKKLLIAIFALGLCPVFAQRPADETLKMESSISELSQNALTGIVVIKEGNNIRGINPETKQEAWKVTEAEIGKTTALDMLKDPDLLNFVKDKESVKNVPGTPYVEGMINYKFVIINSENGKLVYNSAKENFIVLFSQLLYEDNQYLFFISENKRVKSLLVDLTTGQEIWRTDIANDKVTLSSMFSSVGFKDKAIAYGNKIFALNKGLLSCIDRKTGKLDWTSQDKYTNFFPMQNGNNVVVTERQGGLSTKELLSVLNVENGKGIWEDAIKTKRVVYVEDWNDKILVAHSSGFNFFDLKSGEKIWKKDPKGDGIKRVIPIDEDFLFVAENEMMLIDKDGQKKWKKFIEISDNKDDEIFYLDKVGDKVFYLTATYGNMVDYKSGIKLWKRNIKFNENRPVLSTYDKANNVFLVYNDEKLYKFDPNISDKPEPFADVNIKNEKELNNITLFPWGVSLTGPVELMGVGMDGKVIYHNVYKQPGEGARMFAKGASIIGGIALGTKGVVSQVQGSEWQMTYRDAAGNTRTSVAKQANAGKLAEAAVEQIGAANLLAVANKYGKRFNALKQNENYAYIFAKGDKDEKLLMKVAKSDGKVLDKIIFANNRPVYEVDDATENIFYVNGNNLDIFNAKK